MPEGCIAAPIHGDRLGPGIFATSDHAHDEAQRHRACYDGVVRDKAVLSPRAAVWCAVPRRRHRQRLTFVGWQEPIGCGGCAIFPETSSSATTTARW